MVRLPGGPDAPLVLAAQLAAIGLRSRPLRRTIAATGTVAIAAMFLFVTTLPVAEGMEHDPNIGAGLLMLMLVASLVLLVAAAPSRTTDTASWRPVWREDHVRLIATESFNRPPTWRPRGPSH